MIFGGRKQEVVINVMMQATTSTSNATAGGGNLKKIIKLPGQASLLRLRKEISREFKI